MSLMLITAGYLNFTSNQEEVQTSIIADRDDLSIGDAQLVSTVPSEDEENKIENLINGEISTNQTENETPVGGDAHIDPKNEETIETNAEDYYFTTSKLDRNTMYSELLETYQEMYNNTNATAEQKSEALAKINEINNTKNAIMIAENLIIAKGFKNTVIFVNDESISVVVEAEELKQEQVAQIQNIVMREADSDAEDIHIVTKN